MGGIFGGKPKIVVPPAPKAPPPPAAPSDPDIKKRTEEERLRAAKRKGRRSTFMGVLNDYKDTLGK